MHLLVVVVHQEETLDDVLSALVELELPDSVVLESRAGLELLERDLPLFAGVRSLVPAGIDFCRTVLCLIEDPELAREALAEVERLGSGDATERLNAAFLLPVAERRFF